MTEPPIGLRDEHRRDVVVGVEARALGGMRKQARVRLLRPEGDDWELACDEGRYLGGESSAPFPLAYFCSSIAF